jgi:NAD(P)H-hydrate epimerase
MIEVDRRMPEEFGIHLIQMMENAGRSLAELAVRQLNGNPLGKRVVVACGAGNNGGGGMVAARHLHDRGAQVSILLAGQVDHLKEVPAQQWQTLQAIGLPATREGDFASADLILDALIGYGLQGNPRPEIAHWIEAVNAAGRPVLALDIPSGLDGTRGIAGEPCIRASATLTLALPKTGLLVPDARPYVGDLYLGDIGVPPELYRRMGVDPGPLFAAGPVVRVR